MIYDLDLYFVSKLKKLSCTPNTTCTVGTYLTCATRTNYRSIIQLISRQAAWLITITHGIFIPLLLHLNSWNRTIPYLYTGITVSVYSLWEPLAPSCTNCLFGYSQKVEIMRTLYLSVVFFFAKFPISFLWPLKRDRLTLRRWKSYSMVKH